MMLTNRDISELTDWRQMLHRYPEVSGDEAATAGRLVSALSELAPDRVMTGFGGHGVAAIWEGADPGETVLFRAELDALPIEEIGQPAYRSEIPGKGHMCGHDGHMTILLGLARLIGRQRPARGRVILLFQPAEETGVGAAAVLADPRYGEIRPDWAFALHNMPGVAFGHVRMCEGVMMCASQGLRIGLLGKTAHASMPEKGVSPVAAVVRLIPALQALGPGGAMGPDFRMVTITHVSIGEPAFGIAPAAAEIWVKLRTRDDAPMEAMREAAMDLVRAEAKASGLEVSFAVQDDFSATINHKAAIGRLEAALNTLGISHDDDALPLRASEDFGRLGGPQTAAAMVFLGAGEGHASLHNPDYDFPDALIARGVAIFHQLMRDILG